MRTTLMIAAAAFVLSLGLGNAASAQEARLQSRQAMDDIEKKAGKALTDICFKAGHFDAKAKECYVEYGQLAREALQVQADFSQLGIVVTSQVGRDAVEMVSRKVSVGYEYVIGEDERLTAKYGK